MVTVFIGMSVGYVCIYIRFTYRSIQYRLGTEIHEYVKYDILTKKIGMISHFFMLEIGTCFLYIHYFSGCCPKTKKNNFSIIVVNVRHNPLRCCPGILIWAQCVPVHYPYFQPELLQSFIHRNPNFYRKYGTLHSQVPWLHRPN